MSRSIHHICQDIRSTWLLYTLTSNSSRRRELEAKLRQYMEEKDAAEAEVLRLVRAI